MITGQKSIHAMEGTGTTWAFAPALIPGALQIEEYARAIITATGLFPTVGLVEEAVQVRMGRHRTLMTATSARYVYVITELAMHTDLVDEAVMRQQRDHLARAARLPHVDLRFLPAGAVPWTCGFVIRDGAVTVETPTERIELPARTTQGFEEHFARLVAASGPFEGAALSPV